jgi:hypothetical protein
MAPPQMAPPQERTANNALYVEGLGPGLFYSVDYDRAFGDIAARIGVGYVSLGVSDGQSSASASFLSIPITVSYLGIGSKKHMFEVGGGVSILHVGAGASGLYVDEKGSGSATTVLGTVILGYRMQPVDGGFFLRAGLSPLISKYGFLPWPHIGLGATF